MRRRVWLILVLVSVTGIVPRAASAAPAREMYATAIAREHALRAAWEQPRTSSDLRAQLTQARAIVSAYEAIVRHYPTSGYCDNALWQAASLAAEAFAHGAQAQDRQKAVRLFEFLRREYPASPFAARAANQARRLESPAPANAPNPAGSAESSNRGREASVGGTPRRPAGDVPASSSIRAPSPQPPSPSTAATRALTTIRAIRRTVLAEVVRVSIELDREVPFRAERVENPGRLLFDLPGTKAASPVRNANWAYQDDVVRHIRLGSHANQTTRVVLDLDGVSRYNIVTLYNPYRILIDCERAVPLPPANPPQGAGAFPARPPTTSAVSDRQANAPPTSAGAKTQASPGNKELPGSTAQMRPDDPKPDVGTARPGDLTGTPAKAELRPPSETERRDNPQEDVAPRTPAKKPPDVAAAGKTGSRLAPEAAKGAAAKSDTDRGRVSMARQLGLGIARVVVDPGHGGRDPGAEGPGINEADIVLDIALRVEKLLAKQRGVEVVLTRHADVFVPLEERTAIANRAQADLFLSIHANASRNPNARGIETYYLNFATNPDAEAVAARENAASERTMNSLPDIIKAITLNNKLDESKDLASVVQDGLARRLRAANKTLKSLGVKQAPFVVLIGAAMPSVLVEVSFLTHEREGKLLRTESYRQRIAESLADAVAKYRKGLKSANATADE